jgi:glycosyltransferase involved in cell wall biosynthesis
MEQHAFVIPVYRESPYLEGCIKSLISQTIKSKIIITTSTPSQFTQALAAKYQIPYLINNTGQKGIANDWNFALSAGNAKLLTIAHQDDVYEPMYGECIVENIKNSTTPVLMAFTNYVDLIKDKVRKRAVNALVKNCLLMPFLFKKNIASGFLKKLTLRFGNPICCPAVTYNMDKLKDFKFDATYGYVLDWYAWFELANKKGTFVFINRKLVKHRIHDSSETTAQLSTGLRAKEELLLFELMWGRILAKLIAKLYKLGHRNNIKPL